jgi:hypothetical protein
MNQLHWAKWVVLLLALEGGLVAGASAEPGARQATAGVPVAYQLPSDGALPRTYRVTLAIVDPGNPDWIISQFACGVARTVTRENGGKFSETWDGLDDNFMPVPPGQYAVRGIFMPAERWAVDGEYHSVTPRFVSGMSSFMPLAKDAARQREPFGGDPVGQPLGDVAVGPNGIAVFYYVYLENQHNNPMLDLNRALGPGQFIRSFPSGGAAGGTSTATDGETIWSYSTDGGRKFVYRADGKPFGAGGSGDGANRNGVYLPDGWVTAMAALRDAGSNRSFVYVAQRGRFVQAGRKRWTENETEFADKITVHEGEGGKILAELKLHRPRGLAVRDGLLYALHETEQAGGFAVDTVRLTAGLPAGDWQRLLTVPASITPFALAVDGHHRLYLSDPAANKVYQFDEAGKILRAYGRLDVQKPGTYDPQTLMSPGKLAAWTDSQGHDRLIVVEQGGPNRASEWSDDGKLLRDFMSLQTNANDGYAIDPEHPDQFYVPGHQGWLTRFKLDYASGAWTTDAVWPDVGTNPKAPGLRKPVFIRNHGQTFLAGASGSRQNTFPVYRLEGDRWKLSAAILRRPTHDTQHSWSYFLWHDANGNGEVDDDELTPDDPPGNMFSYHGQNWNSELSFLAINQGGRDVWSLSPSGFDAHGNPIFKQWKRLLTDPVFEARAAGKADAIHGGNELADKYSSDWCQADGTSDEGIYVQARGGKNFSANEGSQHKISRYVPDGSGGYKLKWRAGRTALQGNARPGEMYGGMRIRRPINHLVPVIDQSRCGVLLYTDDGLYVDTLFPDSRRFSPNDVGLYSEPGEFFAGILYPNPADGRVYIGLGKDTPLVFTADGWSLKENPVRVLEGLPKTVSITAQQIASPPEIALSLRGGAGAAKLARFAPALGGAALDGSMSGWESCEPIQFQADKDQTVEVRCLYDGDRLYLRWHARLAGRFDPKPLQPIERIFTHDRLADTLSFYMQADPEAKAGGPPEGRPGDVRVVFGLFKEGDVIHPVALGMYPKWFGDAKPSAQTYATPVGRAVFENVGEIPGVQLGHKLDDDGKGFVLAAALPRGAFPKAPPFAGGLRMMADFSATFGGHNTFWWANRDGSASRETYDEPTEARLYPRAWAPAELQPLQGGVVIRNWLVCGPFGGAGAEELTRDPNGVMPGTKKDWKQATRQFCESATYPPDSGKVDLSARYTGEMIRGYWPDPREVRWKPATIADLDTRLALGPGGQVWYGATWIYAPADVDLEFQFQGRPQTFLRWTLNGASVFTGEIKPTGSEHLRLAVSKKLKLRQGWNQLWFRAYCIGYAPAHAGLVLSGPEETLWRLKLAAMPPTE